MIHTMRIMGTNGDTVLTWDPTDTVQTAEAQRQFEALINARPGNFKMQAFAFSRVGEPGQPVDTFPVEAEKVVITPGYAGG